MTQQRNFSQRCELLFRKGFVDHHNEKNTQCIETKNERFLHATIVVHDSIHALTMLGVTENQFGCNPINELYLSLQSHTAGTVIVRLLSAPKRILSNMDRSYFISIYREFGSHAQHSLPYE